MQSDVKEKSRRFLKLIEAADTISILGHMRPDGDCIGSLLSLYNYITENYKGKTVHVYADKFSNDFKFLNGAKKIKHSLKDKFHYDLSISVDSSDTDRHGDFAEVFSTAITTVCLDHHVSNTGFGDYCYVDADASSCCEVITDMLDMDKISKNTAECLYLGMVHDTGVFKYSSTRRKTMEAAGRLIEKGVDTAYIIDETFYKKSYKQNLLMARCILESNLHFEGKVISGFISKEMFKEFGCTTMDTEGIVEQLRLTEGVEVAVFVYQLTKKTYKFSLRAKNYVDVSTIATSFGGGGHIRAAGFETDMPLEEAMEKVLELVKEQLK